VAVTDQANTKAAGRRATETVEATADPRATAIEASPISSPDPRLRRHRPPLRRDRSGWAIPKNLARSTEVTAIADGSSVNRIAEDAGVSIKTLYRHFDNKDDLFVAVI
jgi:Bacterial regulatory proteins, tetR family